jgi:hypothetical protein
MNVNFALKALNEFCGLLALTAHADISPQD